MKNVVAKKIAEGATEGQIDTVYTFARGTFGDKERVSEKSFAPEKNITGAVIRSLFRSGLSPLREKDA